MLPCHPFGNRPLYGCATSRCTRRGADGSRQDDKQDGSQCNRYIVTFKTHIAGIELYIATIDAYTAAFKTYTTTFKTYIASFISDTVHIEPVLSTFIKNRAGFVI